MENKHKIDKDKLLLQFRNTVSAVKKHPVAGKTMRIRLAVILSSVVLATVLCMVSVFLLNGHIFSGKAVVESFIEIKLEETLKSLPNNYRNATVQLINLSQSLSKSIEYNLSEKNIPVSELKKNPAVLEEIIKYEFGVLQLAVEKSGCSGGFIVLDATVNPRLKGSSNSKAGIYIKVAEQKKEDMYENRWLYYRGFPKIAYENGAQIQSNWDMEFDVTDNPVYQMPMERSKEPEKLPHLYYWSMESLVHDSFDDTVTCSIPLFSSDGHAFGICGFDISAIRFRQSYTPDAEKFKDTIIMISSMDEKGLHPAKSLHTGKHITEHDGEDNRVLSISSAGRLNMYSINGNESYLGLHEEIKMYSHDSVFGETRFAISVMIPKSAMDEYASKNNVLLIFICIAFILAGVAVAIYLSKKYVAPLNKTLELIQADDLDSFSETRITEIDQLIEKIKEMRGQDHHLPDNLFEDFINRVDSLTTTEKTVFRHYIDGKDVDEVLSIMFVSRNTIKSHNKHIYKKLGIKSRDELLLYGELIKKSGLDDKILS